MYFKAAINALVLDFEKCVLSLLTVCHIAKHLLNTFFLIFAKYYGRIWPWKGILLHGLHQNAVSLSQSLFLGFDLNSNYVCVVHSKGGY